jgi:putative SOS response-associated peptidase YedK
MIITNANDLASKIHDRMPVLLQPSDFDRWLTGNAGIELLKPAAIATSSLPSKIKTGPWDRKPVDNDDQ